jgi:hypothetical protein
VAREPLFGLCWSATPPARRRAAAFAGGLVPGIGEVVALVGGPLTPVGSGLGVVKGRRSLGQPGLGRVPRRLRLPGSRLNRLFSFIALAVVGDG